MDFYLILLFICFSLAFSLQTDDAIKNEMKVSKSTKDSISAKNVKDFRNVKTTSNLINNKSSHQSKPIKENYTIAIVSYSSTAIPYGIKSWKYSTIQNYKKMMKTAKKYSVDMIVFPEIHLTHLDNLTSLRPYDLEKKNSYLDEEKTETLTQKARSFLRGTALKIPDPFEEVELCYNPDKNDVDQYLKILACAARDLEMYVVLHTYERDKCITRPFCPHDGYFLFSTAVVLDRQGNVMVRRRKLDVYDEPWLDSDKYSFQTSFTTDFNASFEILMGTELFRQKLKIKENSIRLRKEWVRVPNIILMTGLHEDAPLFHPLQDQITWAIQSNTNLLVAGYSKDGAGGIYLGQNEPTHRIISNESTNLFIYENLKPSAPKPQESMDDYNIVKFSKTKTHYLTREFSIKEFTPLERIKTHTLENSSHFQVHHICVESLCCQFDMQLTFKESSTYKIKLAAIKATYRMINDTLVNIELCTILACENNKLSSCFKFNKNFQIIEFPFVFESLIIRRRIDNQNSLSFSSPTARNNIEMLIDGRDYTFVTPETSESSIYLMYLNKPMRDILIFGIVSHFQNDTSTDQTPMYVLLWFFLILAIILGCLLGIVVYVSRTEQQMWKNQVSFGEDDIKLQSFRERQSWKLVDSQQLNRYYNELVYLKVVGDETRYNDLIMQMDDEGYNIPPSYMIARDVRLFKRGLEEREFLAQLDDVNDTEELQNARNLWEQMQEERYEEERRRRKLEKNRGVKKRVEFDLHLENIPKEQNEKNEAESLLSGQPID